MIDDFYTTLKDGVESTHSTPSLNTTPSYNVDENDKEIEIVPTEGEKKRKQTSVVWNHFSKRKVDGLWKAVYNYCDKKLVGESKNRTRHLPDHFKRCTFMYVTCPPNAETISDALMGCLMDWNVDRNLSTLIVDNCTTNDAAIPIMKDKLFSSGLMLSGDFFHLHCSAHILNLIVKDGMSILDKCIVNIHESVSYWTTTTKRNKNFMETARQLRIQSTKVLALDMPVRWNSTYVMLSTALIYKSVFAHLKQRESSYKTLPLKDDWVKARDLCDKLFLFIK
ncbi:hypothetical protein UlMin_032172 [Ulmus minor]